MKTVAKDPTTAPAHPTVVAGKVDDATLKANALKQMNSDVSRLLGDIRAMQAKAEAFGDRLPEDYSKGLKGALNTAEQGIGNFAFMQNIEGGRNKLPPAQK